MVRKLSKSYLKVIICELLVTKLASYYQLEMPYSLLVTMWPVAGEGRALVPHYYYYVVKPKAEAKSQLVLNSTMDRMLDC